MEIKDVAAVLLAAGRSRRMGAFKPLLPFGHSTVIETCIANLRSAGIEEIVVVVGHRAREVRDQVKDSNVRFAINPEIGSEMSVSIARGVEQVSSNAKAVLIALVDHPGVSSDVISLILDDWMRSGNRLIQPEYHGRGGHPVLSDLVYREELTSLDEKMGLRSFFEKHRAEVRRLPVTSPFVARDMDTWEDYCDLHLAVFGDKPKETSENDPTNEKGSGLI